MGEELLLKFNEMSFKMTIFFSRNHQLFCESVNVSLTTEIEIFVVFIGAIVVCTDDVLLWRSGYPNLVNR